MTASASDARLTSDSQASRGDGDDRQIAGDVACELFAIGFAQKCLHWLAANWLLDSEDEMDIAVWEDHLEAWRDEILATYSRYVRGLAASDEVIAVLGGRSELSASGRDSMGRVFCVIAALQRHRTSALPT